MLKASDLEKIVGIKKRKNISDLVRQLKNRTDARSPNFCLFLGAGASCTSGIRTGSDLVNVWRDEVYKDLSNECPEKKTIDEKKEYLKQHASDWYDSNKEYSTLFEFKYPLQKPRRVFIEKEVEGKLPSIGYAYLVRIAESFFIRTIFTTNFDDLLNEAFYQFSSDRPIVCAHDSSALNISIATARTKILKLHGDYLFENIKASVKDTESLERNTKEKLREFLKEYGLIISGYSGGDESIMTALNETLSDKSFLKNGLYWCFRSSDEIGEDVIKILKKDSVFYVITDGFDPLMAELHESLCGNMLPFNTKIASDRATKVIESYLNNDHFKKTPSQTIAKHLLELEREKKSSLVLSAIDSLRLESSRRDKVTDSDLIVYLSVERLIQSRNFEAAVAQIRSELDIAKTKSIRRILLERLYYCSRMLYQNGNALKAAEEMLSLEPENFYIVLNKCRVLLDTDQKVKLLNQAHEQAPYSISILNQLCAETRLRFESPVEGAVAPTVEDVASLYKKSTRIQPSIENQAWRRYFDFILDNQSIAKERDQQLEAIIDEHLKQNAHSHITLGLIFKYCKLKNKPEYKTKDLFTYLEDGFSRHFPKDYASHFELFADACLEFIAHDRLLNMIERCHEIEDLVEDGDFIAKMIDLTYCFYRDPASAITFAKNYLRKEASQAVDETLLKIYIAMGDHVNAALLLTKLRGYITESEFIAKEASILETQGKFQDAIDKLRSNPDKFGFAENNTATISFLYLKMKEYDKAYDECKNLLSRHNFNCTFEAELINYEFARFKRKDKVDPRRLPPIAEEARDGNAKGVALLLLGRTDEAYTTLKRQAEKDFSDIDSFIRWPVLESIAPRLLELRSDLYSNRRSIDKNPFFIKYHVIDV